MGGDVRLGGSPAALYAAVMQAFAFRFFILFLLFSAGSALRVGLAAAEDMPAALAPGGMGEVASVIDGDTLLLKDGHEVRLVGIQAPKLPLGRPNFEPWPLADEAKAALEELALGRRLRLYYGGRKLDRYGRRLAHLQSEGGLWLQAEMLRRGLARVYSFPDNRVGVAALYRAEDAARAGKRGIWADPYYAIRRPAELEVAPQEFIGRFQIVRGRVESVGEARGRLYINFGGAWKTDFTLEVDARARRRFEGAAGLDPVRLKGAKIEVRGWVEDKNGPMIRVTHPEQIRVLE